jgi:hypothetical protein
MKNNGNMRIPEARDFLGGGGLPFCIVQHKRKIAFL